jgi:hypothetical protein
VWAGSADSHATFVHFVSAPLTAMCPDADLGALGHGRGRSSVMSTDGDDAGAPVWRSSDTGVTIAR